MSRKLPLILGLAAIALGILIVTSAFTVHQTQQAIVMQFGEPRRVITEPGLKFKFPWQNVIYYERRVLNLDPPVESVLLADQKRLLVDAFARYRIHNPLEFFKSVRSEDVLRQRLGPVINASIRGVLGNVTLASVLSEERSSIMQDIKNSVNNVASRRFGIEVVDVRIGRADLPDELSQAVYGRMRSEREREAADFRAKGAEVAVRIRASADREATVIRAEAQREAEILRGQGEASRTRILNNAFGQDREFFNFYRSMSAYRDSLAESNTYMVLSPDSEFFDFFGQVGSRPE